MQERRKEEKMITVTIGDGRIMILGHSGYAPPGEDIVCSAVSALVQTLITSIEELTEDSINYIHYI